MFQEHWRYQLLILVISNYIWLKASQRLLNNILSVAINKCTCFDIFFRVSMKLKDIQMVSKLSSIVRFHSWGCSRAFSSQEKCIGLQGTIILNLFNEKIRNCIFRISLYYWQHLIYICSMKLQKRKPFKIILNSRK